jgi:CRP-like cAMP-binding protein
MPDTVQFLLDGTVALAARTGESATATPPAPLAFYEVLQRLPMSATVKTTDTCVSLSLTVEEARTLLANNADLVQGLFSMLLEHPAFTSQRALVKGQGTQDLTQLAHEGVSPVERVLALKRIDLFANFPADEQLQLANASRVVAFKAGDQLFGEADTPSILLLIDGRLSLELEGAAPLAADAGDAVGIYETLAGVAIGRKAVASTQGAALRIDADDLFDVVGQRPLLMSSLFAALMGARSEAPAAA